jgi:hypothetical protein
MNLRLSAIVSVFTCVAAVPTMTHGLQQRLFNPNQDELSLTSLESALARERREVDQPDMCSYRMRNITKLAKIAGKIFMNVDEAPLYRRTRNHVSYVNLEQPVGKFCMKLWRKLTKVYADLETISQMLHEYNFISRSVDVLIGALQEQMNVHNVNYEHMNTRPLGRNSRVNMDMVKERAQVQLSHVISELSSLELTCTIRRKRNL